MSDESKRTLEEAQLAFAKKTNGRVWELLMKEDSTPEEEEEMIHAAHASQYHWLYVGTGVNKQRGAWLLSHVYTVLGKAQSARHYAQRCMQLTEKYRGQMEDFDIAYAYEGLARALALAGESGQAAENKELARQAGDRISNEEDKEIFLGDLNSGNWYGLK